jgi:hypothetical protein
MSVTSSVSLLATAALPPSHAACLPKLERERCVVEDERYLQRELARHGRAAALPRGVLAEAEGAAQHCVAQLLQVLAALRGAGRHGIRQRGEPAPASVPPPAQPALRLLPRVHAALPCVSVNGGTSSWAQWAQCGAFWARLVGLTSSWGSRAFPCWTGATHLCRACRVSCSLEDDTAGPQRPAAT